MGPMTVTNAIRPSDDNVEAAFARPAGRRPDAAGRPYHRYAIDGRFPAKSGKKRQWIDNVKRPCRQTCALRWENDLRELTPPVEKCQKAAPLLGCRLSSDTEEARK